jgi:hypothetical protein
MFCSIRVTVAIVLCALLAPATAIGWTGIVRQSQIARVERLLEETQIETFKLDERLTVEKLLTALAGRLPKDAGMTAAIDRDAFGDDAAKLAAMPVRLRTTGTITLQSALQDILDQITSQIGVDYAVRPTGIFLTRPRLAASTRSYEIGEALRADGRVLSDKDGGSALLTPARLTEFLTTNAGLRSWETIDVVNGRQLSVFATPARHHAMATLVGTMTRLADLGVYMNARLYEVDREFYTSSMAPLVAAKKDEPTPIAIRVEKPLIDKVLKHTFIQESENTKLDPRNKAVFLARERLIPGTGLTGVSVAVRPEVSPDRRHLRLHFTREMSELVRPDGAKGPDLSAVDPTIRKTTVTGSVDIRDGESILMPIEFRPPGTDGAGKTWVLLARPLIWIESEERERGGGFRPQQIWDETDWNELKREMSVRAKPLPATEDAKAILQAVLTDLLTNKDIAHSREFYGTDANKTVLLSNTGNWEWPEGFRPDLHGYKLVTSRPGPFAPKAKRNRVLGVRLDRFEPDAKANGLFDAPIQICLFNAGGTANGAVIGGCSIYYVPKRVGKKWVVEFVGLLDP